MRLQTLQCQLIRLTITREACRGGSRHTECGWNIRCKTSHRTSNHILAGGIRFNLTTQRTQTDTIKRCINFSSPQRTTDALQVPSRESSNSASRLLAQEHMISSMGSHCASCLYALLNRKSTVANAIIQRPPWHSKNMPGTLLSALRTQFILTKYVEARGTL